MSLKTGSDKLIEWVIQDTGRGQRYFAKALRSAALLLESGDESEDAAYAFMVLGQNLKDHAKGLRKKLHGPSTDETASD